MMAPNRRSSRLSTRRNLKTASTDTRSHSNSDEEPEELAATAASDVLRRNPSGTTRKRKRHDEKKKSTANPKNEHDTDDDNDGQSSDEDEEGEDEEDYDEEDNENGDDVIIDRQKRIRIPTGKVPFYVDASCGKRFFDEIAVIPPTDNYADEFQEKIKKTPLRPWRVRVGDLVIVHLAEDEDDTRKKKNPSKRQKTKGGRGSPHYPFRVPWAPCEVVCIWDEGDADIHIGNSSSTSATRRRKHPVVMMEVRWFYRLHDIPGARQSVRKAAEDLESEDAAALEREVLETDHVSECGADCMLSPAQLHSTWQQAAAAATSESQLPTIHCHCRCFWSVHRKAPVPFGSMEHRQERGWMHSRYMGKIPAMQVALRQATTPANRRVPHSNRNTKIGWKDAFRRAMEKLSLIDASAEAHIHGTSLIGREEERAKIVSFLRSAIQPTTAAYQQQEQTDAGRKCVMFIAGPPGTGKTATVKSVIAQLRQEQAAATSKKTSALVVPPFDFVYLNGMELRHPFDAYVKLWEAVSGSSVKEIRSAGAAAALLEQHFGTGPKRNSKAKDEDDDDPSKATHPVTVLLLDEIDFLVTKKQTVLYNLFDWPWRCNPKKRLIVLGISNTINLPDRLKPSVQSRLGGVRCFFQAYSVQETMTILQQKLGDENDADSNSNLIGSVFEKDAIIFAARKTAVLSGDIRKAFQICKTAVEQVFAEHSSSPAASPPVVRIGHVQKASREIFNSQMGKAIACASSFEVLALVSLVSLRRQQHGGVEVRELVDKMEGIASASGDEQYSPCPNWSDLLGILVRLSEANLVVLHSPSQHSTISSSLPLVSVRVDDSEVEAALRNTSHRQLAEKQLSKSTLF